MNPEKLQDRLTSFWILHTSGWLAYAAAANHDPDRETDGTTITTAR